MPKSTFTSNFCGAVLTSVGVATGRASSGWLLTWLWSFFALIRGIFTSLGIRFLLFRNSSKSLILDCHAIILCDELKSVQLESVKKYWKNSNTNICHSVDEVGQCLGFDRKNEKNGRKSAEVTFSCELNDCPRNLSIRQSKSEVTISVGRPVCANDCVRMVLDSRFGLSRKKVTHSSLISYRMRMTPSLLFSKHCLTQSLWCQMNGVK